MFSWLNGLLGYFLPSTCLLCHALIPQAGCCLDCRADLPWLDPGCERCAKPLAVAGVCGLCSFKPPAFAQTVAAFRYEPPIDAWITGLKFYEQLAVVPFLADCLWHACESRYYEQPWPQLLLPVPLHPERLRARGFNQAVLLASALSRRTQIPFRRAAIHKARLTRPQAELSRVARQKNLTHAFTLKRALTVTHVALIDDVMTTGATAREVARLLITHGVKRVDVWCVARTV